MDKEIYQILCDVPVDYAEQHLKRTFSLMSKEDILKLKNILQRFSCFIPKEITKEGKAALLYDIITKETTYCDDVNNESRFVFASALINRKAVCMGISELYAIMCYELNIPCKIVIGYARDSDCKDGGLHAWNLIQLEIKGKTKWFHCDPTWDLQKSDRQKRFFMKSDGYMEENRHIWLPERYPACSENRETKIYNERGVELLCHILRREITSVLAMTE